ncbi:hypothetical protein H0I76_14650, partial [Limibaculum sp. M0105]
MTEVPFTFGGITYFDLTTRAGGDEATIDGALFRTQASEGSSGTGLIQAFVRVQSDGTEEGYNTSERPLAYDENSSPSFTKSLLLNQVPIVEIDGIEYYEFRLDINQTNNDPLLSLDELKVYTSTTGDEEGLITGTDFTDDTTLVWDLDDQDLDGTDDTDHTILLDYSLQAGSGKSDMFFYVPVDDFGGVDPDSTYVVLYSKFGETGFLSDGPDGIVPDALEGDYDTNDGFEEWSVSKELEGPYVFGYKWEDTDGDGTWDVGESGLGGWTISYQYTVGNGANAVLVSGVTVTADGVADDFDGDGEIDPEGFYVIPIEGNNNNYSITLTEGFVEGWTNTYDGDATPNRTTVVTVNKNAFVDGKFGAAEGATVPLNFGNFEDMSISGTK